MVSHYSYMVVKNHEHKIDNFFYWIFKQTKNICLTRNKKKVNETCELT